MKVILKEDIKKLGAVGDVVTVADGYARNFLLPKKIAMVPNTEALKTVSRIRKSKEENLKKLKIEAEDLAKKIAGTSCTFNKKVGENKKLFGSVTSKEIMDKLKEHNIDVDKKHIILENPIKDIGVFKVLLKLHPEVTTELTVSVLKE